MKYLFLDIDGVLNTGRNDYLDTDKYSQHFDVRAVANLVKYLLMNLIYTENLHRAGGYYGNEALAASTVLRAQYFLPDELINN